LSEEKTDHGVKYFVMLTALYSGYTNTSLANTARPRNIPSLEETKFSICEHNNNRAISWLLFPSRRVTAENEYGNKCQQTSAIEEESIRAV
jgi:hypothetical protein